jgi:hypothetical protein
MATIESGNPDRSIALTIEVQSIMQSRQKYRYTYGLILIALVASGSALAGNRVTIPVSITVNSDGSGEAHGSLGDVYNSFDTVQFISCWASSGLGICNVKNTAGLTKSCSTTDPEQIRTIRALTTDSAMYMNWNASGTCTSLSTNTGSIFHPKKP